MAGDRMKVPNPSLLRDNSLDLQRPAYFLIPKFLKMQVQENKPAVYPLSRQQKEHLTLAIEDIQLCQPFQPHHLQAKYLALLLWRFDDEHEIQAMEAMLVEVMGVIIQEAFRVNYPPKQEALITYHRQLSDLFSLLHNMRNVPALFSTPA